MGISLLPKTLVASAYAAHMARRGADYGFSTGGEVMVAMKRVKARKDYVVGAMSTCRMRDGDGEIRKKRNDTLVRMLREEYGPGFAPGYRSDTKLKTMLEDAGVNTFDQFRKKR